MTTMDEVTTALAPDEPDYPAIAQTLGPDAAPFLRELAGADDAVLAARAVSLAAFLPADLVAPVLAAGSAHPRPAVRVATAAALGALGSTSAEARDATAALLGDPDAQVRSWALRSLGQVGLDAFRDQVTSLAATDPAAVIQAQARRLLGL